MRSTVVGIVALVSLAGCFGPPSQVNAKDSIKLNGTVKTQEGGASPAAKVKLIRHPDPLQALSQVFVAVGSIGLACIGGQLDICSSFEESDSDGGGNYQFAMRGADTQGSTGEALTFTSFAGCPSGGCAVSTDFQIQRTTLTIPAMNFWSDAGTLADDTAGNPGFAWPTLESRIGGAAADDYRVTITTPDNVTIWQQDAAKASSLSIDRRVTQDSQGQWTVVATRKQPGNGTDFTFNWFAPPQSYPNHGLIPLSRNQDCYTQGADGMPSRLARPCPVTDGNPATRFVPVQAAACPSGMTCPATPLNNWIMVDIGFSHPLAFLVIYDLAVTNATANVLVETSDDMTSWTLQQTLKGQAYQTTTLAGAARYLRLRLSDPMAQFGGAGNSEIAIFAPF
ncbi:MAG: hypothetical protein JWN44_6051 [Myxococcales bacterium]|nr:hypothetical protein [Myxococcales bacterium]